MSDVKEAGSRVGDVVIRLMPGVVDATLDRPEVINALNDALVNGLERAITLAEETDSILLVLRGAGGNFCAGADLKYVSTLIGDLENSLFPYIGRLRNVCDALANSSFISLAIIEGYALAGGFEILMACDLAVATTTAAIGDRHLEYGLAPGLGASVRVAHHLSSKQARYLAFTGEV
ncbi:MAG: enoyl-CoA hydratase/isomerase family protein, partial [Burkholderiaceae bacterium]